MTRSNLSQKIAPENTDQADEWSTLLAPKDSVVQPDLTRSLINELISRNEIDLRSVIKVLSSSINENNRETAARALGLLAGDHAMYALELTLSNNSELRFMAKKAAGNSLREHGLLDSNDKLIFNPTKLKSCFKELSVLYTDSGQQSKKRSVKEFTKIKSLEQINPGQCQSISLKTKGTFDPELIANNARNLGLEVSITSHNAVKITGSNWPGFNPEQIHLALEISKAKGRGIINITSGSIETNDIGPKWLSATRILARIAKVLAAEG